MCSATAAAAAAVAAHGAPLALPGARTAAHGSGELEAAATRNPATTHGDGTRDFSGNALDPALVRVCIPTSAHSVC